MEWNGMEWNGMSGAEVIFLIRAEPSGAERSGIKKLK